MRGLSPLVDCARRVEQGFFEQDAIDELSKELERWEQGTPRERRMLGDPGSIVLDTELVTSVGWQLRHIRWNVPDHMLPRVRAMLLLWRLFKLVHGDTASSSSAQPSTRVLRTLLRQVRTRSTLAG